MWALTAGLLADDAVRAVPAGSRLPQAAVALDPEAGVWRQHRQGHVVRLPVAVRHLLVLAPHQTSACTDTSPRHTLSNTLFRFLSAGRIIHHTALKLQSLPLNTLKDNLMNISFEVKGLKVLDTRL